ncbi:MAG: putative ring and ubiquitin domain containing protein [Streblomastix strix]|uniref:Putative ring and ubiquitin domain containing protein n=1 Tax=Streblomastix strix TaxID=222440 RepID=A0A5J4WEC2_9EUKA|nr:MAG: putative ring and ubiquitin domain containing protein [Streblomastix strix]
MGGLFSSNRDKKKKPMKLLNSKLLIVFVGSTAKDDLILPISDEYMTVANLAYEILKDLQAVAAKLSFVAESGQLIELKVNKNGIQGDGQENKFIQALTGFMSTNITCNIQASTKEGEICAWFNESKNEFVTIKLDNVESIQQMKEQISKSSKGLFAVNRLRVQRRSAENDEERESRDVLQGVYERGEVYVESGSQIRIFIKLSEERMITMHIEDWETVLGVKKKIDEEESIRPNRQKLFFNGVELEDEKKMVDYQIQKDSEVQLMVKERVVFQPNSYANLEKTDRIVKFEQGRDPEWRIVQPGLTIEGKCTNKPCAAKGKIVICNFGFDDIDYQLNDFKCPICNQTIKPTKFAFNNCIWMLHFKKPSNSKSKQDIIKQTEWRRTGDQYFVYDLKSENGMKDFKRFVIRTRDLSSARQMEKVEDRFVEFWNEKEKEKEQQKETEKEKEQNNKISFFPIKEACGICHKFQNANDPQVMLVRCGHSFHEDCVSERNVKNLNCPFCDQDMCKMQHLEDIQSTS